MILYLTSSPRSAYPDFDVADYKGVNPANAFAEHLREDIPCGASVLYITANPDDHEENDAFGEMYARILIDSGVEIGTLTVCDDRNAEETASRIKDWDFVVLAGGHVPTQNRFLMESGLAKALRSYDGVVLGISAGSMNSAKTVYAQPEFTSECEDSDFQRFVPGIGLTPCQVLPHFQAIRHNMLGDKRVLEDITFPDSMGHKIYAICDGSYILDKDGTTTVYGEAYLIEDGQMNQICAEGESLIIHQRRERYKGTHPRSFEEKYKEHDPEKYSETIQKVIAKGSTPAGMHISIMVQEILDFLEIGPGQKGLDATLGYGGHTRKMMEQLHGEGHMFALDVDPIEIEKTKKRLKDAGFGEEILTVIQTNFANIRDVGDRHGPFDFILADLGVSSMQIDDPKRGFSYKTEGPLDLRLDPAHGITASELLRTMDKDEIAGMLVENSDEPYAEEIAKEIMKEFRKGRKIETTTQLKNVIETALAFLPDNKEKKDTVKKTCQRVFQALRIDVNSEFEVLESFLSGLPEVTAPGARIAILTFHSGEDRLVKKAFKQGRKQGVYSEVAEDVIRPSKEECLRNGRARSTKMRWAIRSSEE